MPNETFVSKNPVMMYSTGQYQPIDILEWEFELIRVMGKALNISLLMGYFEDREKRLDNAYIYLLPIPPFLYVSESLHEYTHSYLSVCFAWYTPCAVKYQKWSRFFNIFSVDMWICFALSLFLVVITVRCISNYGYKSHLQDPSFTATF
jgi:hypothetical protein